MTCTIRFMHAREGDVSRYESCSLRAFDDMLAVTCVLSIFLCGNCACAAVNVAMTPLT